ncbi:hypothetical protein ATZ36_05965, partial [Candidatus Endomicrobiellum trichonymphae]
LFWHLPKTIYFESSANKKIAPLNEFFVYSVTVSGDSANLQEYKMDVVPEFNRFGMVVLQSIPVINGKTSMRVTCDHTFGPKKQGNLQYLLPK